MLKKSIHFIIFLWHKFIGFFPWYINLYRGRSWYTKTALGVMSFLVGLFLYLGAVDINFLWLFGKSPGFQEIMTPPTYAASEIYSADGKIIGKFFKENRTPIKYGDVNPKFWNALIDTEDERFYDHHGVDFMGILGAFKDAVTRSNGRGASTITQQLAKNMFRVRTQYSTGVLGHIPGIRMLIMKSKEWIIAVKLEMCYDKNDILTMYANTVDFGKNSFGIKTATRTYFNTTPKDMTIEQAAVLVGMLKATTYYNPISHPKNALLRRNVVLNNMVTHGDLTRDEYAKLSVRDIKLNIHEEESYDGVAQYFRQAVFRYLENWEKENGYDLYSSGLKIYTTIDTRMQDYAEKAASEQMRLIQKRFKQHWGAEEPWQDENHRTIPGFIEGIAQRQPFYKKLVAKYPNQPDSVLYYLNKPHQVKLFDYDDPRGYIVKEMSSMDSIRYMVSFMHCSMVAMEPETGAVRAWVGDIDFNSWKYDKATAMRQPGSTFKLFVYTEAMNQGLTPCDKRRDEYISMDVPDKKTGEIKRWTPTNANGRFSGDSITLRLAFARSINSIAVRLGQEMGIRNIIKTAQDMGIKSPLDDEPSLALGSSDVNLLEMVNAYSTIANDGKHHEPVLVTKILDKDGNEVYLGPDDTEQAIPYKSAYLMQNLLKGGLTEGGGTSQSLRNYVWPDTDWGGKTGTSNNHSDAWFMAVSPKLVVGAWVGGEYRSIHFRTGALGQGSKTALPIVGTFLKMVMRDKQFQKYHAKWPPADESEIEKSMVECSSYIPPKPKIDSIAISEQYALSPEEEPAEESEENEGDAQNDGTAPATSRQQTEGDATGHGTSTSHTAPPSTSSPAKPLGRPRREVINAE